ncbi:efflux RND transporter periplasmic adaptor subunit [Terriglobus tenax]|uniref:efflux RND transporter periplasmic adaptor subunit n=1 Tax=Terriglobus tenax TaxID=1111115 RepID=UPI0021E00E38|nr:efflux RND transporter periplasmic adaptor subunit [Terriglobus tenax]
MTRQLDTNSSPKNHASAKGKARIIATGSVIAAALVAIGVVPRITRAHEALAATNESPVTHPHVSLVSPKEGQATSELLLPGNVEAMYSAAVFARTEGYLQRRSVDIGSHVKAGDLLAIIASPEVDQQLLQAKASLAQADASLEQAKAALAQARANEELARLTRERDIPLGEQHAISQQIVDEAIQAHNARQADVAAASANIAAAAANQKANQANVARLQQMQGFERVVAPFDGVITERNVEQGDLVRGGSNGSGKPLFSIAQGSTLRIRVDVPQSQSVNIKAGQQASLTVNERVGRTYTGTIVRSADALNNAARTLQVELQIDNRDGSLLPGMYAEVKFILPEPKTALIVPTSSLVIDQTGPHVVTVRDGKTIHFVPVVIGKDMGNEVEVISGVTKSDAMVASPSDLLHEGQTVETR